MSQDSGFVPIRFRLAGRLLLTLGVIGLLLVGASALTGWFTLPPAVLILSLLLIAVSVYILIVSPKDDDGSE